MSWKELYKNIIDSSPLQTDALETFALQNPWSPEGSQTTAEKISSDLLNYNGNDKLFILELLSPALEPGKLLQDYFKYLLSFLMNPNDLKSVDSATRIVSNALKSHVPNQSVYEDRLKTVARNLLDCFVNETHSRWTAFENIAHGKCIFDDRIALDPSRIPRLEYVIFAFGMSKSLLFYDLMNDLAMNPQARLPTLMLLKMFLILEDSPTYYLIDSELYKTVIKSALFDTDVSVFLTAITILTILLPIVATKAVDQLDNLVGILTNAIQWEVSFERILAEHSNYSSSIDS